VVKEAQLDWNLWVAGVVERGEEHTRKGGKSSRWWVDVTREEQWYWIDAEDYCRINVILAVVDVKGKQQQVKEWVE
jgi:hypothetical protein